jgi:DNA-directed RNA polymerase subunit N (RpoN/RPB10)
MQGAFLNALLTKNKAYDKVGSSRGSCRRFWLSGKNLAQLCKTEAAMIRVQ